MPIIHNLELFTNSSKNEKKDLINKNILLDKQLLYKDHEYSILKYTKHFVDGTEYDVEKIGKYRSVVYKNDKLLAYSPPKSWNLQTFMSKYSAKECYAEEIVEGTMINLFYDKDIQKWEIATKSSFGANTTFYMNNESNTNNKTFRQLFFDVCKTIQFDYTVLPTDYSYSFVFQHPENRIVVPFNECKLYLIDAYLIDEYKITELNETDKYNLLNTTINNINVLAPQPYNFSSYDDLETLLHFMNEDYKNVGIMIYHTETKHRTKMRNPNYEFVRYLRGNQPKLQYRYLELRQNDQVSAYLRYFPEMYNDFIIFKKEIHAFTDALYKNYISCYIKKEKPLLEFQEKEFHNHMYSLHHDLYKEKLKEKNKKITKENVISYVNKIPPAVLMSCLNCNKKVKVD
jgi:hypothetical protein